jgi:prepilin-type N-terminal cleavage/methylation domain-containing protein
MNKNITHAKTKGRLSLLRPIASLGSFPKHRLNFLAFKKLKTEKGFTLVEVLVAIILLGIITSGVFSGLITVSRVLFKNDSRATAKNLAETQMEFVKQQTFIAGSGTSVYTAAPIPTAQSGYSVIINVVSGPSLTPPRDSYLEQITITVTGPGNNTSVSIVDYKVN